VTVELSDYEVEHLIEWHREQQYSCAKQEEYSEAADHQHRSKALQRFLEEVKANRAGEKGGPKR
jgi:hypothetical protein